MGKKYKIVVFALILFIGLFMLTPFAKARKSSKINKRY